MDALTKETSAAFELAAEAMKRSYDQSHQPAKPHAVGDLLLLDVRGIETTRPSKKLDDKRLGPFPVTELIGLQDYRLRLLPSWKIGNTFHTSKLTHYTIPAFPSQIEPTPIPDLAEAQPIIDSIISHRNLRKKTLYLVLLQDQNPEDAKWLPLATLANFLDPHSVVETYHREFPALLRGGDVRDHPLSIHMIPSLIPFLYIHDRSGSSHLYKSVLPLLFPTLHLVYTLILSICPSSPLSESLPSPLLTFCHIDSDLRLSGSLQTSIFQDGHS